jgi:hypothetical protein
MQPRRKRNVFGPGGSFRNARMATKLMLALLVVSVIVGLLQGYEAWIALNPALVVQFPALWQPVTYAFVEFIRPTPIGLLFGALIIWSVGGALEMQWGPRRLAWFAIGNTVLAGLITAALGLVWSAVLPQVYGGGTVMSTALWVAYGWSLGRMKTGFWGLPVTGNVLAAIGVGFVFLQAIAFSSIVVVVPQVLAIAFSYVYVRGGSPRVLVLRLRQWNIQRSLRARSRHLRVVTKDRNTSSDSDRYIH